MSVLRLLHHPVGVMGMLALAFIVWLWRDAVTPAEPPPLGEELRVLPSMLAQTEPVYIPSDPKPKPSPRQIARLITTLKPGMTRAEVEGLVGEPTAGSIQPPIIDGSQTSYATSYEVDPTPPGDASDSPTRTLVTLVFDATKPGHPLLGMRYQEQGF